MIIRQPLPETKTHPERDYDFIPVCHAMADYVLTIRQWYHGFRRQDIDVYAVQQVTDEHMPGKAFLLLKLNPNPDDTERDEVYRVFVPSIRAVKGYCSCFGHNTAVRCKHLDALANAIGPKSVVSHLELEALVLGEL